jgi:glycosyltransferase involved in cell wall biosynthesis
MFALPSWNRAEAFGIALLEAQAAELPVIATDVGTGTSEAFAPGETGLLIPPDDVPALAAAANELLDDPARARAMGQAGRKRVELLNSHETLARGLRAVYEAAWAGAGSPEPTTQLGAPVSAPAGTRTTLVS